MEGVLLGESATGLVGKVSLAFWPGVGSKGALSERFG